MNTIDYFIKDFTVGVPRFNFPQGRHRGPLTQIVERVSDYPHLHDCMLSNIKSLVTILGSYDLSFVSNQSASNTNPDRAALEDLKPALEVYRKECAARLAT